MGADGRIAGLSCPVVRDHPFRRSGAILQQVSANEMQALMANRLFAP